MLISSSVTTFTLEVDYIVNLNEAIITLVDEFNSDNKVYLKKCSKIEDSSDKITCNGIIEEAGYYVVYLNGIKQDTFILAYSSFLTKIINIEPKILIKFIYILIQLIIYHKNLLL